MLKFNSTPGTCIGMTAIFDPSYTGEYTWDKFEELIGTSCSPHSCITIVTRDDQTDRRDFLLSYEGGEFIHTKCSDGSYLHTVNSKVFYESYQKKLEGIYRHFRENAKKVFALRKSKEILVGDTVFVHYGSPNPIRNSYYRGPLYHAKVVKIEKHTIYPLESNYDCFDTDKGHKGYYRYNFQLVPSDEDVLREEAKYA